MSICACGPTPPAEPSSTSPPTIPSQSGPSQAAPPSSIRFIADMPFASPGVQVGGGSEFMTGFEHACRDKHLDLFVLPPKRPLPLRSLRQAHESSVATALGDTSSLPSTICLRRKHPSRASSQHSVADPPSRLICPEPGHALDSFGLFLSTRAEFSDECQLRAADRDP